MLVTFNKRPTEVTALTADAKQFTQDLLFEEVEREKTALLDAIYFALDKMKNEPGRKIIVVCSDGDDTASYLTFDEVLSNVVASDVTILVFGTVNLNTSAMRGRFMLQKLADASGGYAFFPNSIDALKDVMEKLRQSMRSQYSLGYTPIRPMDNSWRKIEVTCNRPGVKLRYREGYQAK
jgi:VWFA-related protein